MLSTTKKSMPKMDITILPVKTFRKWWQKDKPPCAFYLSYTDKRDKRHQNYVGIIYIIRFSERTTMIHLTHEIIHHALDKIGHGFEHDRFDAICRMLPEDYFL